MSGDQRLGQKYVLSSTVIEGFFPAIVKAGAQSFPPLLFGAFSVLLSSVIHGGIVAWNGGLRERLTVRVLLLALGVTAAIVIFPSVMILFGTRETSGINTSLLLQSEFLFAFFICGFFFGESMRPVQWAGAFVLLAGSSLLLFRFPLVFSRGDIMIFFANSLCPLGNQCAKRLLKTLRPTEVLFLRSVMGGTALLVLGLVVHRILPMPSTSALLLIGAYGVVILVVSKIFWYRGLALISVMQSTSLIMAAPAVGILASMLFLREMPSLVQLGGLVLTMSGVFLLTRTRPAL